MLWRSANRHAWEVGIMLRIVLCLLFASLCLPIVAQDPPEAEEETVLGWIVGASDRILRVDPDQSWHVIHQIKGLKHLRVIRLAAASCGCDYDTCRP